MKKKKKSDWRANPLFTSSCEVLGGWTVKRIRGWDEAGIRTKCCDRQDKWPFSRLVAGSSIVHSKRPESARSMVDPNLNHPRRRHHHHQPKTTNTTFSSACRTLLVLHTHTWAPSSTKHFFSTDDDSSKKAEGEGWQRWSVIWILGGTVKVFG